MSDSRHQHPLSDTDYYINHPDKYVEAMANRRRHESCPVYKPKKYVAPPKPPAPEKVTVTAEKDITVTKDGAVFSTGDSYQAVASPL